MLRYNSFLLAQRRKTLKEKLAKKERKREKKRKKILGEGGVIPAELKEVQFSYQSLKKRLYRFSFYRK